jgi:chemotaxis protein CheY-P-specific phosphatase CheC
MDSFIEACREVSSRILEDWGMLLVDLTIEAKDQFDFDSTFYCATTNFHSKQEATGSYSIMCQGELLNILARNLLGNEDQISHEQQIDALKEMSNVLAGNLITAFYGDKPTFDLTPPTAFEMPSELAKVVLDSNRTISVIAEGLPVAISFSLDNPDVSL